jgi:ribonucleoside-diphosphate reductase alpha chain
VFRSERNPMFRSKFSEDIFNAKYAHAGCETWADLARVLVHDVCGGLMPAAELDYLVQYITDLKFIPGGRYLYYAGRPKKFFNNCFAGRTRVLTDEGYKRLDSFDEGASVNVFSPAEGTYVPATMHGHGEQDLHKITFANVKGHQRKKWSVLATRDHRWLTTKGETTNIKVGDVVPAADIQLKADKNAFQHGLVFADGNSTRCHADGTFSNQLRLCGWKSQHANEFSRVTYPPSAAGDAVAYIKSDRNLKELPIGESNEYIASFIRGWVLFDGHRSKVNQIHSSHREDIEFFVEHCSLAGYVATGEIKEDHRPTNFAPEGRDLYFVNFRPASSFAGFKVVAIEYSHTDQVYCPFEPKHNRIVIDNGMDTFQCYLLRAEEDTREDWANLSWKAESCLMTGGGIGADYSVYRRAGMVLKGTGGLSSGPIPKIKMINEMGRNVMQGGSRRSAIYASLDEDHGDIMDFLVSKNWHDMPIGTSGLTIADAKRMDFNFPAPMDMTNISVNYKTKWLEHYLQTGDVGDVFRKNAEQALSTAEPGFSFNFYEKENETLRNACTEVTSEDDSDVCNLGSINLGRIESLQELTQVVTLATKFLVCGTLRAELPYDKVYDVRAKNRRLGLGLMGVHEWLLKRHYRYVVSEELHQWLRVYRDISDHVGDSFCDQLSLSRPVAKRAIAPTGTIGILAGTSTGIEPIFAVAYLRRYLRNGTIWHYQYVVDAAAQELIDLYGLDPDAVESALDLAADYERRIKFQADVQDYVDQAISSTINLPRWGSDLNNPNTVGEFTLTLAKYAHRLRGFTCYPDGARGGQPLTPVSYWEAREKLGQEFQEGVETHDICSITGHGGSCGV